jgi:peptidoglycan/LPS O-acetylase OafA/YrhL
MTIRRDLPSLTGVRFLAALVVVLVHATASFAPVPGISHLVAPGSVGVTFFFVLSGFILTYTAPRGSAIDARSFYARRFARVYPLHLLTWSVFAILVVSGIASVTPLAAVLNVFLLQAWVPVQDVYFSMNGPSWSLSAEAFFYACFPFLIRRITTWSAKTTVRMIVLLFAGAGLIAVVLHAAFPTSSVGLLYVNPAYRIWEFVAGICLAHLFRQGVRLNFPGWLVGVAFAASWTVCAVAAPVLPTLGLGLSALPGHFASLIMFPSVALVIYWLAQADGDERPTPVSSRSMVMLGKWSFSLYLIHLPILQLFEFALGTAVSLPGAVLRLATVVVVAVGLSGVAFNYFEAPVERAIRRRISPPELPASRVLAK